MCDGTATACPSDTFVAADTTCRAAAGDCDVAEVCDGASAACPDDAFVAADTECRAAAGVCDLAESCDGASADCPADGLADNTVECRPAADVCDAAETCDGANVDCPGDAVADNTVECRPSADLCDAAELCDGTNIACPADLPAGAGTECRAAADLCDAAETCDGTNIACPADVPADAGTECRGVAGLCDVAETCDGTNIACPADDFVAGGTECRGVAGVCDVAETCPGDAAACPGDAFLDNTNVCRTAVDPICDLEESCPGDAADCPADGFADDTTGCDSCPFGDPALCTCDGGGICESNIDVVINEVDSDNSGFDALEFVELYDGGVGNVPLDGLVVVFYNGSDGGPTPNGVYAAFDLDGQTTDANGYFLLGNAAVVPTPAIVFADNTLQNGADAVALYVGDDTDFPDATLVPSTPPGNLLDYVTYGTADGTDPELNALLPAGEPQVDEDLNNNKDLESIARSPNGSGGAFITSSFATVAPTPGAANP